MVVLSAYLVFIIVVKITRMIARILIECNKIDGTSKVLIETLIWYHFGLWCFVSIGVVGDSGYLYIYRGMCSKDTALDEQVGDTIGSIAWAMFLRQWESWIRKRWVARWSWRIINVFAAQLGATMVPVGPTSKVHIDVKAAWYRHSEGAEVSVYSQEEQTHNGCHRTKVLYAGADD